MRIRRKINSNYFDFIYIVRGFFCAGNSYQPKNNLEKYGIFYSIQSIIDAIIDIIAMIVKDLGYSVQDDYSNIDILIGIKKLPVH
jgi:uncharacterized protein YutE (UPF0331/DUF86 family)